MGCWPSVRSRWLDIGLVLFLQVCGPRPHLGPQTRKKRTWPISSHPDRTSLVNTGFIIWLSGKCFLRDARVVPSRQNSTNLPGRVANHITGFDSSCPLAQLAIDMTWGEREWGSGVLSQWAFSSCKKKFGKLLLGISVREDCVPLAASSIRGSWGTPGHL